MHEAADALPDGAVVVVVQLLALGRRSAEQRPAGVDQVFSLLVVFEIDQEILLLRAHIGDYPLRGGVPEKPEDPEGLGVQSLHGAEKRGLFVQGLAAVGAEPKEQKAVGMQSVTPRESSLRNAGDVQSQAV